MKRTAAKIKEPASAPPGDDGSTMHRTNLRDVPKVALAYFTGPPLLPPLSTLLERALGVPMDRAISLSNDPRFLTQL